MGKYSTKRIRQISLLCLLFILILLFRKPNAFFHPQLWAEDATIFLKQQVEEGFSAVFTPYAGYLNLGSRLVALLGANVKFLYIPAFYTFSSLLISLGCALLIAQCRLPIPQSCKYMMALAMVLIPHGGEIFLSLTNLQWILATLLPVLFLQPPPQKRFVLYFELALILIVGLTGPFIILFSPLLIYRWLLYKNFDSNVLMTAISLPAILIQLYLIFFFSEINQELPVAELLQWLQALSNFGSGLFLGIQFPQYLPLALQLLFLLVFCIALVFAIYRVRVTYHPVFPFCISLLFSTIVIYAASLMKFENIPVIIHPFGNGQRYFYLPYLFISWLFLIFLYQGNLVRRIGALGIILMLLSSATAFSTPPMQDLQWRQYAQQLDQGNAVKAPINPPGWFVEINPRR